VSVAAFSPDGKTLISASFDNTVRFWDVAAKTEKAKLLESPDGPVLSIPPNGRRQLLKKIAAAGVAAVLVPVITTMTPSELSAQGTCTPIGSPCTADAQCCIGSNGGKHCHHIGTDPPGNFCHDT
jgi:hypothetical protein